MFDFLKTSEYVLGRSFHCNYVKRVIPLCKAKLTDKHIEERIKAKEEDQAYLFLSSIEQIRDDVEQTLKDDCFSDVEIAIREDQLKSGTYSKEEKERKKKEAAERKKASNEQKKEELLSAIRNDDAERTTEYELDKVEAEESDDKKDDNKKSGKLGFNRFMIEDVRAMRRKRPEKANMRATRNGARERTARRSRTNPAMNKKVETRQDSFIDEMKPAKEVELNKWSQRMTNMYPEFY